MPLSDVRVTCLGTLLYIDGIFIVSVIPFISHFMRRLLSYLDCIPLDFTKTVEIYGNK